MTLQDAIDAAVPHWSTLPYKTVIAAKKHPLYGSYTIIVMDCLIDGTISKECGLGCVDEEMSELHPELIDAWLDSSARVYTPSLRSDAEIVDELIASVGRCGVEFCTGVCGTSGQCTLCRLATKAKKGRRRT